MPASLTLGILGDNTATGWTSITPEPDPSFTNWTAQQGGYSGTGTRFIFVDPAGSNSNPGTKLLPVADPYYAKGLLRTGDWMLLKKAAVWPNMGIGKITTNGYSAQRPIVIAGCDFSLSQEPPVPNPPSGGNRPQLQVTPAGPYNVSIGDQGYGIWMPDWSACVAVLGIDFYSSTNDPGGGTSIAWDSTRLLVLDCLDGPVFVLVEDCLFRYGWWGMVGDPWQHVGTGDMRIRRCQIIQSYSQGLIGVVTATNNYIEECLIWHNGWSEVVPGLGGSGTQHNLYLGYSELHTGHNIPYIPPCHFNRNIIARGCGTDEFRGGLFADNNLFVAEASCIHHYGCVGPGYSCSVTNNVFVELQSTPNSGILAFDAGSESNPVGIASMVYQSLPLNSSPVSVTGNLMINTPSGFGHTIEFAAGMDGCNWGNNILYNIPGAASPASFDGGIVTLGTITPGSGYTDISRTIASAHQAGASGEDAQNSTGTTLILTSALPYGEILFDRVWVEAPSQGISGMYYCYWTNHPTGSNSVILSNLPWNSAWAGGFSGTVYFPYYSVRMTGGTASTPAYLDIISKGGGIISAIPDQIDYMAGDTGNYHGFHGVGYTTGDIIFINGPTAPPGLNSPTATFSVPITKAGANTYSLNTVDIPGTGSHPTWSDPTRTVSKYAQSQLSLGSSATWLDFLNAATAQRNGNWATNLTAKAVNDWIRQGFGITGTTPVISPSTIPATGTVGTTYPTQNFTASGGTSPYTWTHSGNIPPGLTFNDAIATLNGGVLTTAGSFTFTVNAKDSASTPVTGSQPYTITVSAGAAGGPSVRFVYHKM
jgi:hypothetical protein